jgi:hypothetical protein
MMEDPKNIAMYCDKHAPKPIKFTGDPKTLIGAHVKLRFATGVPPTAEAAKRWPSGEHMWVKVSGFDGETLTGTLDNEPVFIEDIELGDEVEFTLDEIEDVHTVGSA